MSLSTLTPPSLPTAAARGGLCPFHDGVATLDLLLAELDPHDTTLFDAVLDLRSLASGRHAGACLAQDGEIPAGAHVRFVFASAT